MGSHFGTMALAMGLISFIFSFVFLPFYIFGFFGFVIFSLILGGLAIITGAIGIGADDSKGKAIVGFIFGIISCFFNMGILYYSWQQGTFVI